MHETRSRVNAAARAEEERRWAEATTLEQLGELTACWITASVRRSPWYGGRPNRETVGIRHVLARINRGGLVTTFSQPACGSDAAGGGQRAAVSGFASPRLAERIEAASCACDLVVLRFGAEDVPASIPVSLWSGRGGVSPAYTRAGYAMGPDALRWHYSTGPSELGYPALSDEVLAVLAASEQITILDGAWGRRDLLWRVLDETVAGQ